MEWSNAVHGCVLNYSTTAQDGTLPPVLTGSGTLSSTNPAQGSTVTYTFTLSNNADSTAGVQSTVAGSLGGAEVTGVSDSNAALDGFSSSIGSSTFTVSYLTLPVHQSRQFTVTVLIDTSGPRGAPCPVILTQDWLGNQMANTSGCEQSSTRIPLTGAPSPVVTSTVGQIATAQFTVGANGTNLYSSWAAAGLSYCGNNTSIAYTLYDPAGAILNSSTYGCGVQSVNAGSLFPAMVLPAGTYQISIVPGGLVFGTYTLQLFGGVSGPSIPLTGAPTATTTSQSGQSAVMSFTTATGGQTLYTVYSLNLTGCYYSSVAYYLYDSTGTQITGNFPGGWCPSKTGAGAALTPVKLPQGSYTLFIVPDSLVYGSYGFQLFAGTTGTTLPTGGGPASVTTTAGHASLASFQTTSAGQTEILTAAAQVSPCTSSDDTLFVVWGPNNEYITDGGRIGCSRYADPVLNQQVAEAGTYVVEVIPLTPTTQGSYLLQQYTTTNNPWFPVDGTLSSVATTKAGQSAVAQFTTTSANQALYATYFFNAGATCGMDSYVMDATGKKLGSSSAACGPADRLFDKPIVLPTAGDYFLLMSPRTTDSGTWNFQLFANPSGTTVPLTNTATSVTTTKAGKAVFGSFTTTTAHQLVYASVRSALGTTCTSNDTLRYYFYDTSGAESGSGSTPCNGNQLTLPFSAQALPTAGKYLILALPPATALGTYTFQVGSSGTATAVPLTGAYTTVKTTSSAPTALATFTTTAANQVVFSTMHVSGTCTTGTVAYPLTDATGVQKQYINGPCNQNAGAYYPFTVATPGTYQIQFVPPIGTTVSYGLQLWSNHSDGAVPLPGSASETTTIAGQAKLLSFVTTTANRATTVKITRGTGTACSTGMVWVSLYSAAGTWYGDWGASCTSTTAITVVNAAKLGAAGTYYLEVEPIGSSPGSFTVALS